MIQNKVRSISPTDYYPILNIKFPNFGNTKLRRRNFIYSEIGVIKVNYRKLKLGNKNMIGAQVTKARLEKDMLQKDLLAKLQVNGIEMSLPALSLLEGQKRPVFDYELFMLAKILEKDINWFFNDAKSFNIEP